MADDVEAVVGMLGLKRYVIVGHSMGGKVAQVLAKRGAAELVV
jgi:pimeloyl-ACP methyl ester carboxylesterase